MKVNKLYKRKLKNFIYFLVVLIITLAFIFPILWQYLGAFKKTNQVIAYPPVVKFRPTIESWVELEHSKQVIHHLKNSIINVGVSTIIILFLSSLSGYALARFHFRGRNFIGLMVLVLTMIPVVTLLIPFYDVMRLLGLIGSHGAIILVYVAFNLPFCVWLMRGYFLEIPIEVEEAAYIDGCSKLGVLMRIVLPLSKPGMVSATIFTLMMSWSDFIFAGTLGSKSSQTLPVIAAATQGKYSSEWGQLAALTIIITLPIVVFTLFTQQYLVKGLTHGAVKG
jgi:multiple sugar transport system permease protein